MNFTSTLKCISKNKVIIAENHHWSLSSSKTKKWILFIFLFTSIFVFSILMKKRFYLEKTNKLFSHMSQENFLDGCRYVYIDLGTNIGIQIRKLYEPHLYPNALVLPLFKEIFGNHSHEVCSIG